MVEPTSTPLTRSAIRLPTITSNRPGVKVLPSTTLMLLRTLKAVGVTPRNVMLVGIFVPFLGRVVMTTTSHEARGLPSAPRATRGSTAIRLALPMSIHEVSSDIEPRWVTMALLSEPVELKAILKPRAMDRIVTNAATTKAIPKMASRVTFQRERRLRTL